MSARIPLVRRLTVAFLLVGLTLAGIGPLTTDASSVVPAGARKAGARYGIDVSHWQRHIDWKRVSQAGVKFAIAKATDGINLVDKTYPKNSKRARRAGIAFTAYHYARPGDGVASARAQADFFLSHAKLQPSDLVPALDLERSGGLGPVALEQWVMAFLKRVEQKLGVKPIVYTSPGFWTGWMDNTRSIVKAGFRVLWVAHYDTARPAVPAKRWNGNSWTFWQWTKCGHVDGIRGCVDRDALAGMKLSDLTIDAQHGGQLKGRGIAAGGHP